MKIYVYKRFLQLIVVLLGISFLTFLLTYLSPGDPARLMLMSTGVAPSDELVSQVRHELGLDQPFLLRYGKWLGHVLVGDFGISYKYDRPVLDAIVSRLPATLKLTGTTMLMVVLISLPLGIGSALYRNRFADYLIRFISFAGISMPNFWLGILLMYIFGVKLQLLPVMGSKGFKSIILPACTLAVPMISKYVRQIRVIILEELSQNYITGARPRGVTMKNILNGIDRKLNIGYIWNYNNDIHYQ